MTYFIHTDGGARGNPGNAAIGIIIKKDALLVTEFGMYIGQTTNNVAEYTAVKEALTYLLKTNQERGVIQFFLDSELVVKQLTGVYKIKDIHLQKLAFFIFDLIKEWGNAISFTL
jgi:ribonuclease HI